MSNLTSDMQWALARQLAAKQVFNVDVPVELLIGSGSFRRISHLVGPYTQSDVVRFSQATDNNVGMFQTTRQANPGANSTVVKRVDTGEVVSEIVDKRQTPVQLNFLLGRDRAPKIQPIENQVPLDPHIKRHIVEEHRIRGVQPVEEAVVANSKIKNVGIGDTASISSSLSAALPLLLLTVVSS